jgi:hypothetical protein
MKTMIAFLIVMAIIPVYFVGMHYTTTITVENLKEVYHQNSMMEIKAIVEGFGSDFSSYSFEFPRVDKQDSPGLGGLSVGGDGKSYLDFPLPFKQTIDETFDLSQDQSDTGRYEMRFSTLGQEFREEFTLIP